MSTSQVDSLLRTISSSKVKDDITKSYSEVSESMKEVGTPTNNTLLNVIHSETKRNADETVKLASRLSTEMNSIQRELSNISRLLEIQNEMLSGFVINSSINKESQTPSSKRGSSSSSEWYYQGTRLSSRYHVMACILFHLIGMVQTHMEMLYIQYPDSVDCDFKTMHNAVRVVCTNRCHIGTVEYKSQISLKDKDNQAFDMLYPAISSSDKNEPYTMSESSIGIFQNAVVRSTMQELEWIRQRLVHLDGILSAQQIDILKSIGFPVVKTDSNGELNWNKNILDPRHSHPLTEQISSLTKTQRDEYMKAKMNGKTTVGAHQLASLSSKVST